LDDIVVVFVVVVGIEAASEIVLAWVRNQIDRIREKISYPCTIQQPHNKQA
jgi:hypothetical protein